MFLIDSLFLEYVLVICLCIKDNNTENFFYVFELKNFQLTMLITKKR